MLPVTIQPLFHTYLLQTLMSDKSQNTQIQSLLEAFFLVTTFGYTEKNKHGFGWPRYIHCLIKVWSSFFL